MKNLLILIFFAPCFLAAQTQFDIVIKNGKIMDGTGNSWYYADIAVKDGRIVLIQKQITSKNRQLDVEYLDILQRWVK